MTEFKSKYVYPIFILRLVMLTALNGAASLFIFIGIPGLLKQHSGLKALGLISLGLLFFTYFFTMLGKSTFKQRYSVLTNNGETTLHDNVFARHISLSENFKGFSLSNYGDRSVFYNFKTLIFYFSDGNKIELPQFLYTNFKDILPWLQGQNIKFLGHEPYKWKNLTSRHYHFE